MFLLIYEELRESHWLAPDCRCPPTLCVSDGALVTHMSASVAVAAADVAVALAVVTRLHHLRVGHLQRGRVFLRDGARANRRVRRAPTGESAASRTNGVYRRQTRLQVKTTLIKNVWPIPRVIPRHAGILFSAQRSNHTSVRWWATDGADDPPSPTPTPAHT